jgi:hypothetical protein
MFDFFISGSKRKWPKLRKNRDRSLATGGDAMTIFHNLFAPCKAGQCGIESRLMFGYGNPEAIQPMFLASLI